MNHRSKKKKSKTLANWNLQYIKKIIHDQVESVSEIQGYFNTRSFDQEETKLTFSPEQKLVYLENSK